MKRELFYLSLAAAGFTHPSAVSAGEKPKQKPNVIIIFADDRLTCKVWGAKQKV